MRTWTGTFITPYDMDPGVLMDAFAQLAVAVIGEAKDGDRCELVLWDSGGDSVSEYVKESEEA